MVLLLVGLAGFAAALVDGALGMGFGPTSSTILLTAGLAPAAVSTTVNIAKVASGTAGGLAHWRFGNIDRRLVVQLALPGCVGALIGTTLLANIDGDDVRPYLAGLLCLVGLRILIRFTRTARQSTDADAVDADEAPSGDGDGDFSRRGFALAALAGGVTNGLIGAWGPVVSPVLLSRKGLSPRVAIGSVNTAEIAVALVASSSLLASLGGAGVKAGTLIAMLVGGVTAAPVAAWVVRHIEPRLLGVGAGGLLLFTSTRDLAAAFDIAEARWLAYAAIAAACLAGTRLLLRSTTPTTPTPATAPVSS